VLLETYYTHLYDVHIRHPVLTRSRRIRPSFKTPIVSRQRQILHWLHMTPATNTDKEIMGTHM